MNVGSRYLLRTAGVVGVPFDAAVLEKTKEYVKLTGTFGPNWVKIDSVEVIEELPYEALPPSEVTREEVDALRCRIDTLEKFGIGSWWTPPPHYTVTPAVQVHQPPTIPQPPLQRPEVVFAVGDAGHDQGKHAQP